MDWNHDLLNQNQTCYRCTTGKYKEVRAGLEPAQVGFAGRSLTIRAPDLFKVENPGNDPGSPDFQSGAYTMFANSPLVEIKGLEPLTVTV